MPLTRKLLDLSELENVYGGGGGGQDKNFKVIDSLACCVDKKRQSMKSLSIVPASTCRSLVGVSCFYGSWKETTTVVFRY